MFPAYPAPTFTQWTTRDVHGFFAESLFLVSHTGTHVDAPFHFEPKGRKLHEMPLDRFVARGHVLDLRGLAKKAKILPEHLRSSTRSAHRPIRKGDAILLRTRWWERHRGTPAYLFQNPGATRAAAKLLLKWGSGLVGIDAANIDNPAWRLHGGPGGPGLAKRPRLCLGRPRFLRGAEPREQPNHRGRGDPAASVLYVDGHRCRGRAGPPRPRAGSRFFVAPKRVRVPDVQ